mmetsp:Transcript_75521/g.191027  ORF Transcript_75521/g.191027 Transcript_75521/m.191027 type:complete len:304 (+) Transcript_75521:688-1599(+)
MRLCADPVQASLLLRDGRQLGLQLLDFILDIRCLGSSGVDPRVHGLDVICEVLMLEARPFHLRVAVCLLLGLSVTLFFQFADHIFDQALDLGKRIGCRCSVFEHGCDARRELSQRRRMVLLGQLLHCNDDLRPREASHFCGGNLKERRGPSGCLLKNLHRLLQSCQLCLTACDALLVVVRGLDACCLNSLELFTGTLHVLDRRFQVTLCLGLVLLGFGLISLLRGHILRVLGRAIIQGCLQQVVLMLRSCLGLPQLGELCLRILPHLFQDRNNAPAALRVGRGVRCTKLSVCLLCILILGSLL